MKKNRIIAATVVLAVAGSLFITPVQTFAVNAMGVFRASDPNVITISAQDLTEITQNIQTFMNAHKEQYDGMQTAGKTENTAQDKQNMGDTMKQYETTLNSASDFKAFSFSLPAYFKDQAPTITQISLPAKTVEVDTANINKALAELQSPVILPDSLDGSTAAVIPSPAVIAEYPDAICFATQKPVFDLPGNMGPIVNQAVSTLPLLTDDIRSQLGNINLFDKNIYLPNVEGVTKTADLGGVTGYIYAVNDIASLGDSLLSTFQSDQAQSPSDSTDAGLTQKLQEYAGFEVILWVRGDTLYGVAGKYTDDQLAAIAKTMR